MTASVRQNAGRGLGWCASFFAACLLAACGSGPSTGSPEAVERRIAVDCEVFPSTTPKAQFVAAGDLSLKLRLLREAESLGETVGSHLSRNLNGGFPLTRETLQSWLAINYARLGAYDHALRMAGDLKERDTKQRAVAGIASAYALRGDIEAARKLTVSLPQGSPWHAWEKDTLSIYAAAALARSGNIPAAREKLRSLGVEDAEIDWRIAPWLVDAGLAREALALLDDTAHLSAYVRAQAFTAISQAAFRAGLVWAGREAAVEAHRVRRAAGYALLSVPFMDLSAHLGLVDLLYSEEQDAAASMIADELREHLVQLVEADNLDDVIIFDYLLLLFELQRSHQDVEGALRSLRALRRRSSPDPDAAEHWARVAATNQVWTMIMKGQVKEGLRLAESLDRPSAHCSALGNVVSALSGRGDFPRAWQVAETLVETGDCRGEETSAGLEEIYFPRPRPFSTVALHALAKGDPETACQALGRVEHDGALIVTVSQMVNGLARAGYIDLAAEVAQSINDEGFRFIAMLEAVDPRPVGARASLPLLEWWGEPLTYR